MKDQYFGDVNDYRKYGLLRSLAVTTSLRVGVCWLLTRDDGRRDGEHRAYLSRPEKWTSFDPELFARLQRAQQQGLARSVRLVSRWQLLPGAAFVTRILPDSLAARDEYFAAAFEQLSASDLIFFDPDNGIEVPSVPRGRKNSSKYLYWCELAEAWRRGKSLLLYQHYRRTKRSLFHEQLASAISINLNARFVQVFATPFVAFFLIAQEQHRTSLARAASAVEQQWCGQIALAHNVSA